MRTQTVTDYAAEHGIAPADMQALIAADPDPVPPAGDDPRGRTIQTSEGVYRDALYPLDYLEAVAESIIPDDDQPSGRTIGDAAGELHGRIINLLRGRGYMTPDDLKAAVASMSGRTGAGGNAVAAVAIHQLEREGRIVRSKSGRTWRTA